MTAGVWQRENSGLIVCRNCYVVAPIMVFTIESFWPRSDMKYPRMWACYHFTLVDYDYFEITRCCIVIRHIEEYPSLKCGDGESKSQSIEIVGKDSLATVVLDKNFVLK